MSKGPIKSLVSICAAAAVGAAALWAVPGTTQMSQERSISLRDTFPVGSNGLCEAQIQSPEAGAGLQRIGRAPADAFQVARFPAAPALVIPGNLVLDRGLANFTL